VKFFRDNGITGEIACEHLDTKDINKAFRLGLGYDHLAQVNRSEVWPGGLLGSILFEPRETQVFSSELKTERRNEYIHKDKATPRIKLLS
jgi:hypothetical protein